jgi:phosphoglycolate phosphatase-like HAD superfamily hydrolase
MKALIFFDINGTLIKRDSRTDLPYSNAIDEYLNVKDAMKGINTSARSDKDVFLEVLQNNNLRFTETLWNGFLLAYEKQLILYKSTDVWRENADAIEFVTSLASTNHLLTMITGELSIGAQYKLEKLGIWKHFPTGGFGEDGLKRFDIADAALKKAKLIYGTDFDEMYVIGDTLLDIHTARHLGAKIISIATGSNTKGELANLKPDFLIERFEEVKHLFL